MRVLFTRWRNAFWLNDAFKTDATEPRISHLATSSSLSLVSSLGGAKTRGRNEKHISGNAQQIMLVKFCTGPSCRGPEVLSHMWPCNFWLFIFALSKYRIFRYLKTFPVAVWLGLANKTTCFGWGNESACWYSFQRHWEHLLYVHHNGMIGSPWKRVRIVLT